MERKIKVLDMVIKDVVSDVKYYEGRAFNGKNVAEYFGKQAAAISAIAKILKAILEEKEEEI